MVKVAAAALAIATLSGVLGSFIALDSILRHETIWFGIGCFVAGISIGLASQIISNLRSVVSFWPVLSEVLNWQKVDALLLDEEKS